MKNIFNLVVVFALIFTSCKKEKKTETENPVTPVNENYASIADFHIKNSVPKQTFTLAATVGGTFVTPQGTTISVLPNAFLTSSNTAVTGTVNLEFKDIYKKSDMLLSDVPTINSTGELLKSGGEFWINATENNASLKVKPATPISVKQPLNGFPQDNAMQPFVLGVDANLNPQWNINNNSSANPNFVTSVNVSLNSYVFSLYGSFTSTASVGTWCNSDNPSYFQAYSQSTLTIDPTDDITGYKTDIYLVFKNINCMVHVYGNPTVNYPYKYAPIGLECTVVAIATKDGNVYSSFVPVIISANQTVNFVLSATTTDDFKSALNALN